MQFADLAKSFAIKKWPDSEVELTGEIPADIVLPYETPALKHFIESLELPGFRKGHVPEDIARKKIREVALLEEAVGFFLQDFYPELIDAHKVDAVGRPAINIIKLAPKNPIGVVVRVAVYPDVKVHGDWKELHTKIPLEPILHTPEEKGEERNKKEFDAIQKRRGKIIDVLLEQIEVSIPKIFVESELEKIQAQLKEDVSRFGLKFDDYLKQVQKTEEQVRNDFLEQAKKRAKLQLGLNKIAEVEKVEADNELLEQELKHALEHFPAAKPELVRIHIKTALRNEKVLRLLEGGK